VYNSPTAAHNGTSRVYPYPICIRHYARTDRTGNRVPISGNIISVTRRTASENSAERARSDDSARLCAPANVTGKAARRTGKRKSDRYSADTQSDIQSKSIIPRSTLPQSATCWRTLCLDSAFCDSAMRIPHRQRFGQAIRLIITALIKFSSSSCRIMFCILSSVSVLQ